MNGGSRDGKYAQPSSQDAHPRSNPPEPPHLQANGPMPVTPIWTLYATFIAGGLDSHAES